MKNVKVDFVEVATNIYSVEVMFSGYWFSLFESGLVITDYCQNNNAIETNLFIKNELLDNPVKTILFSVFKKVFGL